MATPKQVLIVEDYEPLATVLRLVVNHGGGFQICGVAGDIPEAITLMEDTSPDLVIVDLNLPSGSGLDLIPRLRDIHPDARYLMFSQESPFVYASLAREAGASGYIQKGASVKVILEAAAMILSGDEYFPID